MDSPHVLSRPGYQLNRVASGRRCARVVVVEDNGAISSFISEALRDELGCSPIVVDNGARALAMLRQAEADVVLLDINLPGLSGLEVFDRLRADPATAHLPVVFMSAARYDGDLARRGISSFLHKPFDLDDLLNAVANFLGPR